MNITEYKKALQSMDWWFDYSDDHRVWRMGMAQKRQLLREADKGGEYRSAWDEVQQQLEEGTFVRGGKLLRRSKTDAEVLEADDTI